MTTLNFMSFTKKDKTTGYKANCIVNNIVHTVYAEQAGLAVCTDIVPKVYSEDKPCVGLPQAYAVGLEFLELSQAVKDMRAMQLLGLA